MRMCFYIIAIYRISACIKDQVALAHQSFTTVFVAHTLKTYALPFYARYLHTNDRRDPIKVVLPSRANVQEKTMKIQNIRLVLGTLLIAFCAMAHASGVDISKIAGLSMKQVGEQLKAKPTCEKNKRGTKCDYNDGRIEVVYINGKADWISVNSLEQVPFTEAAIARLGFAQRSPSFRSPMVMRWKGLPGVVEVSVFKGQVGSDYAYIKVKTP